MKHQVTIEYTTFKTVEVDAVDRETAGEVALIGGGDEVESYRTNHKVNSVVEI